MLNNRLNSLTTRLSFWTGSLITLIFVVALAANYSLSRNLLESYAKKLAIATTKLSVQHISGVLDTVTNSADTLAASVSGSTLDAQALKHSIPPFIRSNPSVYGMTIALEPGSLDDSTEGFSPYYYRKGDALAFSDLNSDDYRYQEWQWYRETMRSGMANWSDPYLDEGGGNTYMTTYSTPIRKNTRLIGVATADIQLSWLHEHVRNIRIGDSGYGFIVSANDVIVSHPDERFNMVSLLDMLDHQPSLENWQRYLDSKSRQEPVYLKTQCRNNDDICWVAIEALGKTGWKVFIVLPEAEVISKIRLLTIKVAVIALFGLLLTVMTILLVTRRLIRPLGMLATATRDIGQGNLDIALPVMKHKDEISALANDFDQMRSSLKAHIEEIRRTTASKQKLESEIQIARDIQMSMIPGAGELSLTEQSHDLFAYLRPAKSVGGDLYYFSLQDNRLRFIVGDVSDKGVPAAIFMAKTVTLYTRALRDGLTPGETFTMMNDILSDNNDACMFVTALCGELDLDTGHLVMANAGHMHPISLQQDKATELHVDGATALGLMSDISYDDIDIELPHDTALFMYTDGISEARNTDDVEYGEGRLLKMIEATGSDGIELTGEAIITDVDAFAAQREQFDDITLFAIKYH